ncbi:MAG TPA: MoaD/ThiS family protein [Candidatus Dormibacteraeota bacterium]|nr:MoaD/ThiS family protein [Candidatus Dormibacteraeota bacterium]
MIQIVLPKNLQILAGVGRVVELDVTAPVTQRSVLDALESHYPALRGTMRDMSTKMRRPMVRFFACEEDWSDVSLDAPLPDAVVAGTEPFLIIGAIAGGKGA